MSDTSTPAAQAVEAVRAPEATQEAPKANSEQSDPRMQAYLRKEQALQRMRQELDSEKQQLQGLKQSYETDYVKKSRLTEDPFSVLNEAGITYDKLTEMILAQPNQNDPMVKMLRAEIKAIQDKQDAQAKQQQENISKQYEQAIKQIKTEATLAIDGNPEYETIKSMNMYDAVVELIEQTFNSDGFLMDIEEACKKVEAHLVDAGYKMASLPKVQNRFKASTAPAQTAPDSAKSAQNTQAIKTITHNNTANLTPKRSTEKERRERAIAAFHGKNNQ